MARNRTSPLISVVIPVWKEAEVINRTIDHLLSLPYSGEREVIVVDGEPSGTTMNAVRNRGVRTISSERGRARQMNAGARAAEGAIVVFLHADTMLPEQGLNAVSSVMDCDAFVGGAFDLGIASGRPVFRIIERVASLRSRLTRVPYGDQALFVRKDYFRTLGGFRDIPLMEDVEFMGRIKKDGRKIHIIPQRVNTSPRRWEKEGVLYCTLRNWMLMALYSFGVPPEKLVKLYR